MDIALSLGSAWNLFVCKQELDCQPKNTHDWLLAQGKGKLIGHGNLTVQRLHKVMVRYASSGCTVQVSTVEMYSTGMHSTGIHLREKGCCF